MCRADERSKMAFKFGLSKVLKYSSGCPHEGAVLRFSCYSWLAPRTRGGRFCFSRGFGPSVQGISVWRTNPTEPPTRTHRMCTCSPTEAPTGKHLQRHKGTQTQIKGLGKRAHLHTRKTVCVHAHCRYMCHSNLRTHSHVKEIAVSPF